MVPPLVPYILAVKGPVVAGRAHNAIHAFETAMAKFEEAAPLAAKDEPAPILHYNRCVRALTTDPELTRASHVPEQSVDLGD